MSQGLSQLSSSCHALAAPQKVVVSGAGGQTGQALFRKLLALPDEFAPLGLVRSESSKRALLDAGGGVPEDAVAVVDVTDFAALQAVIGPDVQAVCIATSAKPAPSGQVDPDTQRPVFTFPQGDPELVDWIGQKNQIDACPAGAQVVLCSTMGGTDPNHPLNNLGRTVTEDGTRQGGMIVQWKRKSEVYLMAQSPKLQYTIVHPGGLLNEPGGERALVPGVDDSMEGTESRTVPREDVAQVMLEAFRHPDHYAGRSFDLRAKPVGEAEPTTDFARLLAPLEGRNCDYSLGATL